MSEKLATGISMVLTAVSLLNNSNTSKVIILTLILLYVYIDNELIANVVN